LFVNGAPLDHPTLVPDDAGHGHSMIVDMHAHIIPENFPPAGTRPSAWSWPSMDHFEAGRARVMIGGGNYRTVHDGNWSVERRLRDMKAQSVDVEVISPMPELCAYWFTAADALDFCRYTNDVIVRMCAAAPGRFIGLGIVPLQDPEMAAKELAHIKSLGFPGVELGSNVNGQSLGMAKFQGFFQEAERLGIAVFVHALRPTMMERFPTKALFNPVGYPTDTSLSIASMIDGGTAEKCPRLKIAFSHGGGTFPFLLPRYNHHWSGTWNEETPVPGRGAAAPDALPRSPAEYARRFYYDTLLFDRRALRYLIDMVGAGQILVGTDYPYMAPELPVDKTLRTLNLPPDVHADITWNNCFRFLGMTPPSLSR
jgi:aminocarboxymuconate-semialdehyde decarboxylase